MELARLEMLLVLKSSQFCCGRYRESAFITSTSKCGRDKEGLYRGTQECRIECPLYSMKGMDKS